MELDELAGWLARSYDQSLRTAYLILGDKDEAADATQEAFLRAWRFRSSVRDDEHFDAWLYRVLVNACRSRQRREIPILHRRTDADALEFVASEVNDLDAHADLRRALADLPMNLRVVVVLRFFGGLSEAEVAHVIDRPVGTVKSRTNEAKRRLAAHPALARREERGA